MGVAKKHSAGAVQQRRSSSLVGLFHEKYEASSQATVERWHERPPGALSWPIVMTVAAEYETMSIVEVPGRRLFGRLGWCSGRRSRGEGGSGSGSWEPGREKTRPTARVQPPRRMSRCIAACDAVVSGGSCQCHRGPRVVELKLRIFLVGGPQPKRPSGY